MKKKIIVIGLIVIAGIAATFSLTMGKQAAAVEVIKVSRGNIAEYVEEKGTVKLSEEASVYSSESGKILEVPVTEGDEVKAGDILARMDDTDIRLQIKALEAQKQSACAKYQEARTPVSEADMGKLSSQLQAAEIDYENAKRAVESGKKLLDGGAISLDAYQSFLAAYASAEAALRAAESNIASAKEGISAQVKRQYEAQIAEIQARIEQLQRKQSNMNIKSDISGTVLSVSAKEGSIAQPGTLLFEIGNKNSIYLESDILLEDMGKVKEGAAVLIENEDLGIKDIKGTIRKIYPKAVGKISDLGIEQKRVKVEISLGSDNAVLLKPGYDVDVKIVSESIDNALLIDEKAVFDYQGKNYVFVNDNGVARLRQIEKGIESGDMVEVLKGLSENDIVILSPDEKIKEGSRIRH